MEEQKIPYFVHEGIVARQERTIKRLWILCIVIFAALIATNGAWIWYESQWEDQVVTQEVDTGEGTAVITGVGDISYGETQTDSQNP